MKSDVGRELGIEHMGWRVITVTSSQVLDLARFEVVAKEAAARLKSACTRNFWGQLSSAWPSGTSWGSGCPRVISDRGQTDKALAGQQR